MTDYRTTRLWRETLGSSTAPPDTAALEAAAEAWLISLDRLMAASSWALGEYREAGVGTLDDGSRLKGNVMATLRKP